MNERIQKLAIEAGFYANPDVEKFEKFAELIVAECVQEVEGMAILMDAGHDQWNRAIGHTVLHLKEHFGVEE